MLRTSQFSHNGRNFEVRSAALDNEIKVRLFENGKPASPIVYSITIETAFDAQMRAFPLNLVDGLMQLMEDDTITNRLALFPNSN